LHRSTAISLNSLSDNFTVLPRACRTLPFTSTAPCSRTLYCIYYGLQINHCTMCNKIHKQICNTSDQLILVTYPLSWFNFLLNWQCVSLVFNLFLVDRWKFHKQEMFNIINIYLSIYIQLLETIYTFLDYFSIAGSHNYIKLLCGDQTNKVNT